MTMNTKISLISDIHLECTNHYDIQLDDSSILILGGDILLLNALLNPVSQRDENDRVVFIEFLTKVSEHYEHVIFIAGNHEFYHGTFMGMIEETKQFLDDNFGNIHFLERDMCVLNDIVFIGATLWTDMDCYNKEFMAIVQHMLYDYKAIRSPMTGSLIEPKETVDYHFGTLDDLSVMLMEAGDKYSNKPIVMCTHHAPSKLSVHPRFKGSPINVGFYSDLSDFIDVHDNIAVWTHGHMHDPCDYMVKETRILCNPRGYDSERPTFEVQPIQFEV
jgi:hypothetical protein